MLMDRAVICQGTRLGKGVTIGVLTPTEPTKELRDQSLFVGNPPFERVSKTLTMQSKRRSIQHLDKSEHSKRQIDLESLPRSVRAGGDSWRPDDSIMTDVIMEEKERSQSAEFRMDMVKQQLQHHDVVPKVNLDSVSIPRAVFEYVVIGYSSLLSLEIPILCIIGLWFYAGAGAWYESYWVDRFVYRIAVFFAVAPMVGIAIVGWMIFSALAAKYILVGDFSTFVKEDEYLPETHIKVFRWRLTYLLVVDAKKFLQYVDNYHLTRWFWGKMGVKIGKRVMIHPEAFLYETDLLYLEDDTHVEEMATLFCHTFRTRHLELKKIHVGKGAHIGINSVVLPGCEIGDDVTLLPLTQVFPTERIKAGTWHGNPAEPPHSISQLKL
jgi:carbonic anhydrase/acetyltransferase-like protein (isoleucine patch superfamily)